MKRLKKFIWYFIRNPYYALLYVVVSKLPKYTCKIDQVNNTDLVQRIKAGVSLIRFGDGDIYIAHSGDQSYQKSSKRLKEKLFDIFKATYKKEHIENTAPFLVGIPIRYLELSNKELQKKQILQCWLPFKIAFKNHFNSKTKYFDSHLFYQTGMFERYIQPELVGRNVVFVSNKANIVALKAVISIFKCSPYYIETPHENSFNVYDDLYNQILQYKKQYQDVRVILATGTTSKVLAFDLSQMGIICYDIGWGIMYTQGENQLEQNLIV